MKRLFQWLRRRFIAKPIPSRELTPFEVEWVQIVKKAQLGENTNIPLTLVAKGTGDILIPRFTQNKAEEKDGLDTGVVLTWADKGTGGILLSCPGYPEQQKREE